MKSRSRRYENCWRRARGSRRSGGLTTRRMRRTRRASVPRADERSASAVDIRSRAYAVKHALPPHALAPLGRRLDVASATHRAVTERSMIRRGARRSGGRPASYVVCLTSGLPPGPCLLLTQQGERSRPAACSADRSAPGASDHPRFLHSSRQLHGGSMTRVLTGTVRPVDTRTPSLNPDEVFQTHEVRVAWCIAGVS